MNFDVEELQLIFLALTFWNHSGRLLPQEKERFEKILLVVGREMFKLRGEQK